MTSRLALFDQTISASLRQPGVSEHDYKAYRTRIKLKILEQRGEVGEKELKFQISRDDDFEFLYAGTLNNDKYQAVARQDTWKVDFDTFPKAIIKNYLCKTIVNSSSPNSEGEIDNSRKKPSGFHSIDEQGPQTEIVITLTKDKNQCVFEILSRSFIKDTKDFSMTLSAVRGDHLITHLLKICSNLTAKVSTCNKANDDVEMLEKKCMELELKITELDDCRAKNDELIEQLDELEDELALVKDEKETIRGLAEEKDEDMDRLKNKKYALEQQLAENRDELEIVGKMLKEEQNRVDQLQKRNGSQHEEIMKLRSEKASLQKHIHKSEGLLRKNDLEQNQQSLDIRKLRELEADLKEKDSMVGNLTETISLLRKELEDEKLKLKEVEESFEKLKVEHEKIEDRLQIYRSQRYSPAPGGLGLQTTLPTGYKPAFGQNSPFGNPNMNTPYRNVFTPQAMTPFGTTAAARFNSQLADDTNGSTMMNTPPVMRNPL